MHGGMGISSLIDEYHIGLVATLSRLLFSRDTAVASAMDDELGRVVRKWMGGNTVSIEDKLDFLNCEARFDGHLSGSEAHSIWTRMRRSTRFFVKFFGNFKFIMTSRNTLGIVLGDSPKVIDLSSEHAELLEAGEPFPHSCPAEEAAASSPAAAQLDIARAQDASSEAPLPESHALASRSRDPNYSSSNYYYDYNYNYYNDDVQVQEPVMRLLDGSDPRMESGGPQRQ
uniref:Uncharacterized protein n=1 Tax=Steinernema glaseri TaxID=37863 RepID=A0A1I8AHG1_9BILA